jgi:biopolymer transport protein TolQ
LEFGALNFYGCWSLEFGASLSVAFPQKRVITYAGDAGMLVPEIVAAGGGLLFAFDHATIAGKVVLSLLAVASIFSWSIMITKLRVIRFARKQNARFLAAFRQDRQPLRLFEKNARFPGSPVFNVYRAGCEEMTFHLLGSPEVDDTFRARLEIADKISPAQMGAATAAMERAVGETALSLESQMILLATAVSGSPFLGLLGTVWGVMDAFTGVAEAGSPNLVAMAPGVSGAPRSASPSRQCSVTTFSSPVFAGSSWRWTTLPPNSRPSSSTNMSITARARPHCGDEHASVIER